MTFGEHLEELRKSLGKALLWLAVGLVFGLVFFADRVVRYVQEPLKDAIQQFNTDRDLARLGVEPVVEAFARQAGVPVESTRYEGVTHGFFTMTGQLAAARKATN